MPPAAAQANSAAELGNAALPEYELQPGADPPRGGERGAERGGAQVARAGRAAGAGLGADDPLDHLHVPVAPFLDTLVDVDQGLTDLGRLAGLVIDLGKQCLDLLVR